MKLTQQVSGKVYLHVHWGHTVVCISHLVLKTLKAVIFKSPLSDKKSETQKSQTLSISTPYPRLSP